MVAREAAETNARCPTVASAQVMEKVAKRTALMRERDMRGAVAAAKGRAKRSAKTVPLHQRWGSGCYLCAEMIRKQCGRRSY